MVNAKERRRLKRQLDQQQPVPVLNDQPVLIPVVEEITPPVDVSKLNAKERRLLRRQQERGVIIKPVKQVERPQKRMKNTLIPRKIHRTLFVGQLPFNVTKQDIQTHFIQAGEIQVRMLTNKSDGKFRGMAFIELENDEALGAALSRHHTLIKGRRINVELTASGGGTKSTLRKERIEKMREKQKEKQSEKAIAILNKIADNPESKFTKEDLDDRLIDFATWFDIETTKKALQEFHERVTDKIRNRKAFMMDILKKYRETDGDVDVKEYVKNRNARSSPRTRRN